MPNRLARESSPYLLQHKHNPVDWYPWGHEALDKARDSDRPILLSIGYSSCHWCHVMERESFENLETATYMNEHFVPVKVDREERPDIDAIYMDAVQAMTGRGGWPLTVFLTPNQVPFYGGTYFPPKPASGTPSLHQVMEAVIDSWQNRRDDLELSSKKIAKLIEAAAKSLPSAEILNKGDLVLAQLELERSFDRENGGFGHAPKFPQASALEFLIRRYRVGNFNGAAEIVNKTLKAMGHSGIHDQLAGGFHRYSVDESWIVPHFEKMLYDNALLARAYLHGWQAMDDEYFKEVCQLTLDWALSEMRGAEGGFYSAIDADSEGAEGKFYVWSYEELQKLLGDDMDDLCRYWGAGERGSLEGMNILHIAHPEAASSDQVVNAGEKLLESRGKRVRPALDDKRLTSWNALMISALADAGAAMHRPDYIDAAIHCVQFILKRMHDDKGRLLRTYRDGQATILGYLEDHALLLESLMDLHNVLGEGRWLDRARTLADTMIECFFDADSGAFYTTSKDHDPLLVRPVDFNDHPIPSGNSAAAFGLLRLANATDEGSYKRHAMAVLRKFHSQAASQPLHFAHLLSAIDFHFDI